MALALDHKIQVFVRALREENDDAAGGRIIVRFIQFQQDRPLR